MPKKIASFGYRMKRDRKQAKELRGYVAVRKAVKVYVRKVKAIEARLGI
jgi:hypothetical protein